MIDYVAKQAKHNRIVWNKLFAQNILYVMQAKHDPVIQEYLIEKLDPTHIDEDVYKVDYDWQYLPY
jgi:hypothetical protein